jgi:TonB family protein
MRSKLLLLLVVIFSLPCRVFGDSLSGNAGVCIKLNTTGQVLDARVVESSGSASVDQAILQLVLQLHWDKPYPHAGWMPIRYGIGSDQTRQTKTKPLPSCENFERQDMI